MRGIRSLLPVTGCSGALYSRATDKPGTTTSLASMLPDPCVNPVLLVLALGGSNVYVVSLDLDLVDLDGRFSRRRKGFTSRDVEESTVQRALHLSAADVALRQRGVSVGANIVAGVDNAVDVGNQESASPLKSTEIISPGVISLTWATLTKPASAMGFASPNWNYCRHIIGYHSW